MKLFEGPKKSIERRGEIRYCCGINYAHAFIVPFLKYYIKLPAKNHFGCLSISRKCLIETFFYNLVVKIAHFTTLILQSSLNSPSPLPLHAPQPFPLSPSPRILPFPCRNKAAIIFL